MKLSKKRSSSLVLPAFITCLSLDLLDLLFMSCLGCLYLPVLHDASTMVASPWAKEWKSLANDSIAPANSQKAIILATFNKAYGSWPSDIPQQAIDKFVAGRSPDEILRNRHVRTPAPSPRPRDTLGPANPESTISVDDGDDTTSPPIETTRSKRKRADTTMPDLNTVLLVMTEQMRASHPGIGYRLSIILCARIRAGLASRQQC